MAAYDYESCKDWAPQTLRRRRPADVGADLDLALLSRAEDELGWAIHQLETAMSIALLSAGSPDRPMIDWRDSVKHAARGLVALRIAAARAQTPTTSTPRRDRDRYHILWGANGQAGLALAELERYDRLIPEGQEFDSAPWVRDEQRRLAAILDRVIPDARRARGMSS